tara:strand:+ start:7159 stop:8934 length:1776 start_codon:yes stop_codon:yes gene_type:complete
MLHNEKIKKTISSFIESQLPLYVELHYDKFAGTNISKFGRFMQLYYEWLEKSYPATISDLNRESIKAYKDFMISHLRPEDGNLWNAIINLEYMKDVDNAKETLLRYIRSEFNPDLPMDVLADRRKLVKRMKDLNRARGTIPAFRMYFDIVFDKVSKVVMKQDHVFTTNDNDWEKKSVIRVLADSTLSASDMAQFKGYYMVGQTSGAKSVVSEVGDVGIGTINYKELGIDKPTQSGTFSAGEILLAETEEGSPVYKTGTTIQLKAIVQNSIQGVNFTDASNGGSGYYLDDVVTFGSSTNSEARIKKLTKGGIDGIKVTTGADNSVINFVNDYLTVYGMEGTFVVGKGIIGAESGATAVLRFKDNTFGENKYWIDNITGTFKTDHVKGGEYSSEEIYYYDLDTKTKNENIRMRADKIVKVCEVTATAESTTGTKSNIISPGVGYTSLPKMYITNSSTDSLQPHGSDIGGIEELEIIRYGLASSSSTVTFRDTSSGTNDIRAVGTVTYGAEITYGGEYTRFKSNPSQGEVAITDADYFTWWSYVVSASEPPEIWKEQLKKFTHPAGMKVFADYLIDTTKTITTDTSTTVVNASP